MVTLITFVLYTVYKDNLCFAKSVFFVYLFTGLVEFPFYVIGLSNHDSVKRLITNETCVETDVCSSELVIHNFIIFIAAIILYITLKSYFACVLFELTRQI